MSDPGVRDRVLVAPTLAEVEAAQAFVRSHLAPTPLLHVRGLSELLGCDYYVKCESLQPVGAFKLRGALNLLGTAPAGELRNGVVSPSTGNHGMSLADAGRRFGVRVVIVAPAVRVNAGKMDAIRGLGAEVRLHGSSFDEARLEAERVARDEGMRFVHTANEPALIAGVGGMALEIFDALPDADVIVAPVGGGSCAAAVCIVAKGVRPATRVIAVQSAQAPAMWHAFRTGRLEPHPKMETIHEGIATRVPFELTMGVLWRHLDEFVLLDDDEITAAIPLLARHARLVAEGAGAASLAAAHRLRHQLRGKKVVGVLTGGNIPTDRLAAALSSAGDGAPSQ